MTYKRGRWTVTDFYDGPSCTPCNSSPTTPSPLATFAGPRITNPGGQVDGSVVTSPPIVSGTNNQVHPLVNATMDPSQPPDEPKLSSENSSLMANRGMENQPDVVPCMSANPPGLLSPEDRKTSLPNIPGALILQSPAGRLARKTSLHDSHKIGGFTVEPVLDPSDPIAPVTGQVPPTNPIVAAVSENSSSSSSSSSTADASSSNTASPSASDATPMVTVVQAHPSATNCNSNAVNPSNNNAATVNASATATHNPVNVVPKPAAAVPVLAAAVTAAASVNVSAKPPIASTVIPDVTKTFSVTTVPENVDGTEATSNVSASNPVNHPETQQQTTAGNQQPKETPMEVSGSPESTVTAAEGAALTAAIEAVAATSAGMNKTVTPSDVGKVNVGGQTDHVTFIDESLTGTASNSIASTAPQSVSIPLVSSVAIDNKIEQAMDLVKSHLMFAVREEVDVLKEKIVELLERIQLLETENAILKQAHQNQLGSQGTQSLVTGIQLNTSPVPASLDVSS